MDDFLVYGRTFDSCLKNLAKELHRCEEVRCVLNWEKYPCMVQKGVILRHVVSHTGIEVDKSAYHPPLVLKGERRFFRHTSF